MIKKAKRIYFNLKDKIKTLYDSIDNTHLKKNLLNALPFWVGAFATGFASVLFAMMFQQAENITLFIYEKNKWILFGFTPLCFVLSYWIVQKYAPYAKGSGIPQVTAAIELTNPKQNYIVNKLLSLKIIFIKVCSSLVMVMGGGAIGREGPIIQISASIFKKINDCLPEWYPKISKRNMIVTGAAAGLASAFNTPLGGIVFAIEELTKTHFSFFKSALLTGVIIAGLTALNLLGPYLYLGYPTLSDLPIWIFLFVLLVALVAGLSGSLMGKVILFIFKKKLLIKKNYQKILFVVGCGLIIAALGIFLDFKVFGSGKDFIISTLFTNDKDTAWYIPFLRIIGPILSFSIGSSGGIFAPSLSAGASVGAYIATLFHLTANSTNLLVLCGMVSFLSGITRSPFTSSILVIEMTNSHNIIFYVMLSALLANLAANFVSKHSFYDYLKTQYLVEMLHESNIDNKKNDEIIAAETERNL